MSKDLEKEYKALMDSEAPNLWARIEAGLEQKPVSLPRDSIVKSKRQIKMWAGLAAACACVVLSIPVITRHLASDGGKSYTAAPDNHTAYMECAPEAVAENTDTDNKCVALSGGAGSEGSAQVTNDAAIDSNVAASDSTIDMVKSDTLNDENADSNAEVTTAQNENSFQVTVEILDTDVRMNSGILYTASVLSSEYTDVQTGSEIKIFSAALAEGGVISLEESHTYVLTLAQSASDSEEDETVYTLQAVGNP